MKIKILLRSHPITNKVKIILILIFSKIVISFLHHIETKNKWINLVKKKILILGINIQKEENRINV